MFNNNQIHFQNNEIHFKIKKANKFETQTGPLISFGKQPNIFLKNEYIKKTNKYI